MSKLEKFFSAGESKVQITERGSRHRHPFDIITSEESAEIIARHEELEEAEEESQNSDDELGKLIEKAMATSG